jgi:hypothetical protein
MAFIINGIDTAVIETPTTIDPKNSVRSVTAGTLPAYFFSDNTLIANVDGALAAQSGVTLQAGNNLLVKDESNKEYNGLYRLVDPGDNSNPWILKRTGDADTNADVTAGARTLVYDGTSAGTLWYIATVDPFDLNNDDIDFVQIATGGGGGSAVGTPNDIQFVDPTTPGAFQSDVDFAWDGTAKRMELGLSTPSAVEIQGGDAISVTTGTDTDITLLPGGVGKVGAGTATPRRTLEVLDSTDPQLRLSRADNTTYVDLQTTAGDNLLVEGSAAASFYNITRGPTNVYSVYQSTSTGDDDGSGKGLSVGVTNNVAYIWMNGNGSANNGTMKIGVGGGNFIEIDSTRNAVFIENLSADGNVTLGDSGTDEHTLNGTLQFAEEVTAPAAPVAGDGGIFYVKTDGIPYYISDTTVETALTGGGGGGGGGNLTLETQNSTTSLTGVDKFVLCDPSGVAFTLTLPSAATAGIGSRFVIKDHTGVASVTNYVELIADTGDTIDGKIPPQGHSVTNPYGSIEVVSDGATSWWIR